MRQYNKTFIAAASFLCAAITKYGFLAKTPYFIEIFSFKIYTSIMKKNLSSERAIYSSSELRQMGFSYYQISQLVQRGELQKLTKSCYENLKFTGNYNDFYFVPAFIPDGIICLMSAAVYYNLSTFRPYSIDVAVPQKKKVTSSSKSIQFTLHYFSSERLSEGIQIVSEGENSFKIYDIEKTVVDILSNRNKIGVEETKEILVNYLARPNRNINKLYRYAEKFSCLKTLKTYLEVLV